MDSRTCRSSCLGLGGPARAAVQGRHLGGQPGALLFVRHGEPHRGFPELARAVVVSEQLAQTRAALQAAHIGRPQIQHPLRRVLGFGVIAQPQRGIGDQSPGLHVVGRAMVERVREFQRLPVAASGQKNFDLQLAGFKVIRRKLQGLVNGVFGVGQAVGGIGGARLFQRCARAQIQASIQRRAFVRRLAGEQRQDAEQRQSRAFEMNSHVDFISSIALRSPTVAAPTGSEPRASASRSLVNWDKCRLQLLCSRVHPDPRAVRCIRFAPSQRRGTSPGMARRWY